MQMPPTGPLSEKEIEIIRAWIHEGAPWDAGASFTKEHAGDAGSQRNCSRRFVVASISAMRSILRPKPEVDSTLSMKAVRRRSLWLPTGPVAVEVKGTAGARR